MTSFRFDSGSLPGESTKRQVRASVRRMRLLPRVLVLFLGVLFPLLGGCFEPPTVVVDEPPVPIAVGTSTSRFAEPHVVTCEVGAGRAEARVRLQGLAW